MNQPAFMQRMNTSATKEETPPKVKVIFYGDAPTCATGFGQVSRNILPALRNSGRYDIDVLGINYWGDPHNYPFRIWPMAINNDKDPYGRQRMQRHLSDPSLEFDIFFCLQDTFILAGLPEVLSSLKKAGRRFKSVFYFPIDGTPKPNWVQAAASVDYPVTYTKFGQEQVLATLPELEDRLQVLPHGVDPRVFFPVPSDEVKRFREQFFGKMSDKFIFTNVNRNQQRKDIPATILAFKEFKKHRPDSLLYLHMAAMDQGWNLPEVIKSLGLDITSEVILPQNFTPAVGFPLEVLNLIYNCSDAVISTTVGEGWGLSWTEAMATKTPVIFPINTCLGEYITEETGFPVRSGGDPDHTAILPHDNEVPRPTTHISHMVERMVELYDNREEGVKRSEAAYTMVHDNLIWEKHINARWVDLFDQVVKDAALPESAPAREDQPVLKGDVL